MLELLQNVQVLYKEKNKVRNTASIEDEADGIMDHVDSKTRGAQLFFTKGVAKSIKGDLMFRAGAENWRAPVRRMVTWSTQTNDLSRFKFLNFWPIR